jgi:hypothetical protein
VRSRSAGRKEYPMSADTNRGKMDLRILFGSLAEAVEQASPEDLLAEAKAAGQNTEQIAADVKNTLLDAVLSFEQRKLHAARSAYRTRSTARRTRRFVMPATPAERLRMLTDAATRDQRVAKITAKFRDLTKISDDDVRSAIEDLMELGAFDDIAEQDNDGND